MRGRSSGELAMRWLINPTQELLRMLENASLTWIDETECGTERPRKAMILQQYYNAPA